MIFSNIADLLHFGTEMRLFDQLRSCCKSESESDFFEGAGHSGTLACDSSPQRVDFRLVPGQQSLMIYELNI